MSDKKKTNNISSSSKNKAKKQSLNIQLNKNFGVEKPKHLGGLGNGVGAFFPAQNIQPLSIQSKQVTKEPDLKTDDNKDVIIKVPLAKIHKCPWQPRQNFNESSLAELAESIKSQGVIQPLICRKRKDSDEYELIGGERRLRAAGLAGLKEVPIIILDVDDRASAELALVENLQREDLNVVDEAEGYQVLIDSFNMTQADVAERVGKARETVTNALRLLSLPEDVKPLLRNGSISTGHAKVLLSLQDKDLMLDLANKCVRDGWPVRLLEQKVRHLKNPTTKNNVESDIPSAYLKSLEDKLCEFFRMKVKLLPSVKYSNGKRGKGRIEVEFADNEALNSILETLGIDMNEY